MTKEIIEKFIKIYFERFKIILSPEEGEEKIVTLVNLIRVISVIASSTEQYLE